MKTIKDIPPAPVGGSGQGVERIIQFGEGNFLRAFVGWLVDKARKAGDYDGKIVSIQPIGRGLAPMLNAQDCRYTVILRGVEGGKTVNDASIVESMSRCLDPYSRFEDFLALAAQPEMRFVVSNTTEAGIAYSAADRPTDRPPASYPGKLAVLLRRRYELFGKEKGKGFVVIPCELIDRNGEELKKIVYRLAREWGWDDGFIEWLDAECAFMCSLVDRIVPGYPKPEAEGIWERIGYRDELLDTAEPFLLWVIEGDPRYAEELPLHKSGLGVVWTRDMTQYRTRKVRILNGAHTMTVLAAYLSGIDTVGECVSDPVVGEYLRRGIFGEIIPTVDMERGELEGYAAAVLERFANPFIRHECISISLNSVSKFKARVLPSLEKSCEINGKPTPILAFSLAGLAAFYRGYRIENGAMLAERAFAPAGTATPAPYQVRDDLPVLERMLAIWKSAEGLPPEAAAARVAAALLREEGFWGRDLSGLPGLEAALGAAIASILALGAKEAMAGVVACAGAAGDGAASAAGEKAR